MRKAMEHRKRLDVQVQLPTGCVAIASLNTHTHTITTADRKCLAIEMGLRMFVVIIVFGFLIVVHLVLIGGGRWGR